MIKVLSKEVKKLIRENPKAIRKLLQMRIDYADNVEYRVMSDDGTRELVFKLVRPTE